MAKGYTLEHLTVSRKIEFFPEKRAGKWFGDTKGVTGQQGCLFADIKIQVFRKRVCDSCVNDLKTEFVWVHA